MSTSIDVRTVVSRHSPRLSGDDDVILSVGNGGFAAGVDRTGTQTFCGPGSSETRVNTLAEWGWHTMPDPPAAPWESLPRPYDSPRGRALHMDLEEGTENPGPTAAWFRENPHKLSLLRFALSDPARGASPRPEEITDADQQLDLWTGTVRSTFRYRGTRCTVSTTSDPTLDALALRIDAPGLELVLDFPYGSRGWDLAADWTRPSDHSTSTQGNRIRRQVDDLEYDVLVHGARPMPADGQTVRLEPDPGRGALDVVLELLPRASRAAPPAATARGRLPEPTGPAVRERAARFWAEHWETTGVLDLGAADDPRAEEIERRAVLSRYLQRVHAAGELPPAETGLLANSWHGKFHLEMHWWHAAHFALWGDAPSLRRSLSFYATALPVAQETARRQGCRGARWPKQIGPDLRESPSDIGPFLLWQQPHPIHLAELVRRADPASGADPMLQELVEQTALCLQDLLRPDGKRLGLGPPLIGAQERHVPERRHLRDPAFELAYTAWALRVADGWRHRRGARDAGELTAIAERIHSPLGADGRLTTFRAGPAMNRSDHPSHLLAHGMVPPTGTIPDEAAGAALEDALADWDWDSTWGWDCPALAMTAARLRRPQDAVDALLLPTVKNRCDRAGHFPQRPGLPAYLPANGGTLVALALMAAGWDDGPDSPGLPARWGARHERILPLPAR
ncbi:hypothetical protein ACT3SP_00180 [Brachybacterium sp. AOP43-C2-M15]|uniref:hypothetical protein n=1 Tax=Brachybacterium sp. AOP43-C2-M15 TaxID=3457661 RepID=UPI0040338E28